MTNAPQENIGKYQVIASLASGSQGAVYRAYDPTLQREVALKVLHPHLAAPEVIERFRREAQIVASIPHPNIAGISEIGEHNGSHYIAIEYVPHVVSELVERGPMDVTHAVSIAHQTALALEAARTSRNGITHHDVKPANLLLTSLDAGGMVKLIDFGIAHAQGMASMTQAGSQFGTPFYMPPEQWAGERGDTRSDIYSLGAVMHHMLAGRVPFDSDAENPLAQQKAIADQHLEAAPVPLRSVREDVPETLEAMVAKCMAKSPAERYQTPGELAAALADAFSLAAPSASMAPSRPPVRISPEPKIAPVARPPRPSRPSPSSPLLDRLPADLRNRVPLLAAGGFGAIIVITLVALMASQSGGASEPPPRIVVVAPPPTPTATFTPAPPPTFAPAPTATSVPSASAIDFIRDALLTPTRTSAPAPIPTATPAPAPPTPTATRTPSPPTVAPMPENPNALADLRVAPETFGWMPINPSVGDPVTFSVTVRNDGWRAAKATNLAYSIESADGAKTGEVDIPQIPAGHSAEVAFQWTAEAGHHNIKLDLDSNDLIPESSEGNNTVARGLLYHGTALADLVVESIEWSPRNPELGQPVSFTATVRNAGEGRAAESALRFGIGDISDSETNLPPISPGETASAAFEWTAEAGSHRLNATADSALTIPETNDDNNALHMPYEATVFVDLYIESVTWTPEKPSAGDLVAFAVKVVNGGNMDAGESRVALVGDAEHWPWRGAESDDSEFVLPGVPAGESRIVELEWTATQETFALNASVDYYSKPTREIDRENNYIQKIYDATLVPDLVAASVAWAPENPALGEEVTVSATVENRGEGRAPASSIQYFVDDVEIFPHLELPQLNAGDSAVVGFAWTAQKGAHSFAARVNPRVVPDGGVIETDYGNNEAWANYDNTRLANLVVESATWAPENPAAGDSVTFNVAIRNKGDADAPGFQVGFREDSTGRRLDDFRFPNGLAAGASGTAAFAWRAEVGAREFRVSADSQNAVDESDEGDNSHLFSYDATVSADLYVQDIEWNPQTPSAGQNTTISVVVANQGASAAGASVVRFTIDGPSRLEKYLNMPSIAPGAAASQSFTWSARFGRFTFTATADANNQIPETDEGNNTLVNHYDATAQADLEVVGINVVGDAEGGSEQSVILNIKNSGNGDADRFTVSLYANGDWVGDGVITSLGAGRQTLAYITFAWPTVPVKFSAVADTYNNVAEKSENNNRFTSNATY